MQPWNISPYYMWKFWCLDRTGGVLQHGPHCLPGRLSHLLSLQEVHYFFATKKLFKWSPKSMDFFFYNELSLPSWSKVLGIRKKSALLSNLGIFIPGKSPQVDFLWGYGDPYMCLNHRLRIDMPLVFFFQCSGCKMTTLGLVGFL